MGMLECCVVSAARRNDHDKKNEFVLSFSSGQSFRLRALELEYWDSATLARRNANFGASR